MISQRAIEAIESTDTDELLRVIDALCEARSWEELLSLRARCNEALQRGKQLWGVEEHIRYRLALEGPADLAGEVISEGASRFTLGPLPEVAASTKTWAELSPHVHPGPVRGATAAERVVKGDRIDEVLELPGALMHWEPSYPTATYKSDRVEAPTPKLPKLDTSRLPESVERISDPVSESALNDLVTPWVEESNGRSDTTSVAGNHLHAIRALGLTEARTGTLTPAAALAWMGWAAASGGAHGRRRGAAAGRYLAWWVVASLGDLDWPAPGEEVGNVVQNLEWNWFDDGSPDVGWSLRLTATDPIEGLSWAVAAVDVD